MPADHSFAPHDGKIRLPATIAWRYQRDAFSFANASRLDYLGPGSAKNITASISYFRGRNLTVIFPLRRFRGPAPPRRREVQMTPVPVPFEKRN
jgi:hypothetical protein